MNKSFKKLISFILCAVLLFTTASVAFAAEETRTVVDSGFCGAQGENLTWTLYDDGELVISGEGGMDWCHPHEYDNPSYLPWYGYYDRIDVVTVEEGVTSIGMNAFAGQPGVVYTKYYKINLPKSLQFVEGDFFDDIAKSRVPGQHLAYSYAGTEVEFSKIKQKVYSFTVANYAVKREYVRTRYLDLPELKYAKVYYNGEEPLAFCELVEDRELGYDFVAHYYSSNPEVSKIIWYSIHNDRATKCGVMDAGEYDVDDILISTYRSGEYYLRADILDAQGKTIVSSENMLIANVPPLGQRIKSFFETFAYMANLLGYLISMSIASDLAIIRNWFVGLFN
ncbi:MAG: hypothetical protein IKK09_06945 [Clostridia bacterium]|nr:hypothetical protein [Clostridia bacterium]